MKTRIFYAGFSLIELMIVISIIGILSTIAIPSYQNYVKRARFAEVISATAPFKIAIALAMQEGTPISELTNGVHGIPSNPDPTSNLASVLVRNGTIIATATSAIKELNYILVPNADNGSWTIEGSCIKEGLCNAS
jgi:prepilin-type N-terminal cleavage/methylation domain-containing protein